MVVRPWFCEQGTHGIEVPSGWRVLVIAPQAGQVILTRGGSWGFVNVTPFSFTCG
jgi:hypothetical protein